MIEQIDNEVVLNIYTIMGIVLTSALTGGALGVTIFGVIARNILSNEAGVKAVEGLADSVPANVASKILEVVESLKPVIELTEEAFDGVPAEEKTPQS